MYWNYQAILQSFASIIGFLDRSVNTGNVSFAELADGLVDPNVDCFVF